VPRNILQGLDGRLPNEGASWWNSLGSAYDESALGKALDAIDNAAGRAKRKVSPEFTIPVGGAPVADLTDALPQVPQSKLEAALMLADILPGGGIPGAALAVGSKAAKLLRSRRGIQELGLTGAFRPRVAPIRGETGRELRAMQLDQLSAQQLDKAADIAAGNPEFGSVIQFFTPAEMEKTIRAKNSVDRVTEVLKALPDPNHLAAIAKAGEPKRGWYRASTQGLNDVFGQQDAPRFAALLAATSPQNSVEMNLLNSLNIWKNWVKAGRPGDADSIRRIMGQSVTGTKGADSVLPAWIDNTVTALSATDPRDIVLSGSKVNSFFRNLADDIYPVTNDAWMANVLGVDQGLFAGSSYSPGYIATNARMRDAAQRAMMFPSEGQETIWSVGMPLYELQTRNRGARAVLDAGLLTPEAIRGTPDFSTLLKDPKYAAILEEAGYGQQLHSMKSYEWPLVAPSLSIGEQRYLDRTAGVLEDLFAQRTREALAKTLVPGVGSGGRPEKGFAFRQQEVVPYVHSGHLTGMTQEPFSIRNAFTGRVQGAFTNEANKDVLHEALGLDTLYNRRMTGLYEPGGGAPRSTREPQSAWSSR
jgi:hypothetical protein